MTRSQTVTAETQRTRPALGFTLVEILIVVVILGILAAVVVPQFASASETARSSSLKGSLQVIRSQVELYHAQHDSTYPSLAQLGAAWNVLLSRTDITGDVGSPPVDGVHVYGPYIKKMPINPFEDSQTVSDTAAAGVGWVYDETTGKVFGVMAIGKADELDMDQINSIRSY